MSEAEEDALTIERFLSILLRCGLYERDQLKRILRSVPPEKRQSPKRLARYLIEWNHLTHFQANKLLTGVWQGLVLGAYQILTPIGKGGMGMVYLARVIRLVSALEGRKSSLVALKILPPKKAKEKERLKQRFLKEMELAQRVDHPNITRTFDAGEENGIHYIVMEYIRGRSIRQVVDQQGPLNVQQTARLFSEVAAGLTHAHSKGLIHRDLKPSNIMITPRGHAKVLDFGLALDEEEREQAEREVVGGQGIVVGTMDYIAPEQIDNSATVDHRADLYSMGCTMYFALTGQPPFPGGKKRQKLARHQHELAIPLQELNPDVPLHFAQLVETLMEKNADRRPANAEEARQALLEHIGKDVIRPLDGEDELTDLATIQEIETMHRPTQSTWDTMPLIPTYDETASSPTTDYDFYKEAALNEEQDNEDSNEPLIPPFLLALMIVSSIFILVLVVLMVRK